MSRRRAVPDGDAHERFHGWLVSGANGEPPRDAALHASVCPDCAIEIGAFDLLNEIDTSRAPLPPSRIGATRGPWLRAARVAGGASGIAIVAVVAGIGLGSALQLTPSASGVPVESTVQEVLGGRGTPQPTDASESTATSTASSTPRLATLPAPDPASTR